MSGPQLASRPDPGGEAAPSPDNADAATPVENGRDADSVEALEQDPAVAREQVLTIHGRSASVRRWGDPDDSQALLALHGWADHGGRWAKLARTVVSRATRRAAVIAPDLPGCGRSASAPEDGHPVFVHDAALLSELMIAAKPKLHLAAHGVGALAACRAALRHPEKTASLTLVEPAAFPLLEEAEDPRRMEALDLALGVTALAAYGEKEQAARLAMAFWAGEAAFEALDPESRAYTIASAPRAAEEFRALSRHTPGALLFEDYQSIEAPMLIIVGATAPAALRASAARIKRAAPQARLMELPGQRAATAPDAVDAAVLAFIDERAAAETPD